MNPLIFREYDIRGLNEELDSETVSLIGKAYATIVLKAVHTTKKCLPAHKAAGTKKSGGQGVGVVEGEKNGRVLGLDAAATVAVGRDNRASSPAIAKALIEGITSTGVNVVFVGEVATPELYYAVHKLDLDGGINVTGSHNPPQYNGFKVLVGKDAVFGKKIRQLGKMAMAGKFPAAKKAGRVDQKNIDKAYLEDIASRVKVERKVKVVVDAGNGMASELGPELLRMLGCEVVELYCEKIPGYPNHIPDPSQEKNVEELRKRIVAEKAELGIAFDGDVDRLGVVDEKGELLYGDRLLGILAKKALQEKPGAKVIFEVKCSQALGEYIRALGGRPIMWKTGHSLIKAKMKKEKAALGGEMSGHMFFALGWYGFDDALLAAAKVIEIVSGQGEKMSEIAAQMPSYVSSPEYRVDFPDSKKFEFVARAKKYFSKRHRVIGMDGCRVNFESGWALIRASNTQPKLIVRMEGWDAGALAKVRREFLAGIKEFSGRELDIGPGSQ